MEMGMFWTKCGRGQTFRMYLARNYVHTPLTVYLFLSLRYAMRTVAETDQLLLLYVDGCCCVCGTFTLPLFVPWLKIANFINSYLNAHNCSRLLL